jgi:hypothetical protein
MRPEKGRRGRRRFTPEEDAVIMKGMQSEPSESWSVIAKRLPGRTALQCQIRWHNYLAPEVRSEAWTPEEDQLLVEKINEMGRTWKGISPAFNGRSTHDIENRWRSRVQFETVSDGTRLVYTGTGPDCPYPHRRRLNRLRCSPKTAALSLLENERSTDGLEAQLMASALESGRGEQKGRKCQRQFTPEEDEILLRAKQADPSESWPDIAKRLPGHTVRQCHNRWLHYLAPENRSGPWTPEEDRLLIEKVSEMGRTWTAISPSFKGRSPDDIRNRWHSRLQFETVHDGTKLIYTGRGPHCKSCNPPKSDPPEELPLRSTNEENDIGML